MLLAVAEVGDAGEGLLEVELDLGAVVGKAVEFRFLSLHMFDKVDEVTRLLEFL